MPKQYAAAIIASCALLLVPSAAQAEVVTYVDSQASGPVHDGSSWCTALLDLQDALDVVSPGAEIRVADGIYKPDRGTADRSATFQLRSGVAIVGGYAGCGADDPDERDVQTHETILSGDLGDNDGSGFQNNGENSYHVVTTGGTNATAVLDGFTIRAGNANGAGGSPVGADRGAGIYNNGGRPTIIDCTISANTASNSGGGMFSTGGGIVLTNCTFRENTASFGGGFANTNTDASQWTNCTFIGNSADWGGGFFSASSNVTLLNCRFINNSAVSAGGGFDNPVGSPTLVNCTFIGNTAALGGGMREYVGSPKLTNCVFTANTADQGGGMYFAQYGNARLTNCILWDNTDNGGDVQSAQLFVFSGPPIVQYSLIQGWNGTLGGVGNIGDDPLFVDLDGADNIPGNADDNLHLSEGSPCVNAGTNNAPALAVEDFEGQDRIQQCRVDMGVDETAFFFDCNANALADACDIADALSGDCNDNSIPDECDIAQGTSTDCDGNGNGIPDECEPDCNANGQADSCDLAEGLSEDCNVNTIPDECEPDCNGNGTPDDCEALVYDGVVFVDASAADGNSGKSWADAFGDLQRALCAAARDPLISEIWVANGTYTPASPGGDRAASFVLVNGVSLYGGFAGGEISRDQRDPPANPTILSGDLDGDDGPGFHGNGENSYHIVLARDVDPRTVLDGFTITGGNANGTGFSDVQENSGAGMFNDRGSPTVSGCTFMGNAAAGAGGGMNSVEGSPAIKNCRFVGNTAVVGGGMYQAGGNPVLANCIFKGNNAESEGGGLFNLFADTTFVNCLFTDNAAGFLGGGLALGGKGEGNVTMANCTFSRNTASIAGGIGDFYGSFAPVIQLNNCVLWENSDDNGMGESAQINVFAAAGTVNYSCIQGLTGALGGIGNIGDDPLFVDPDSANFRLSPGSPAIDAGDNTAVPADTLDLDGDADTDERTPVDLDGLSRFVDDVDTPDTGVSDPPDHLQVIDMGPFEFQAPAVCVDNVSCSDDSACTFDRCVDGACFHTAASFGDLAGSGGSCGPDGEVNIFDILAILDGFAGQFAEGCEPYNVDISGGDAKCGPDRSIDLLDIIAVLDAFQGTQSCDCAAP